MDWWKIGNFFRDWEPFLDEQIPGPDQIEAAEPNGAIGIEGEIFQPPFRIEPLRQGATRTEEPGRVLIVDSRGRQLVSLATPDTGPRSRLGHLAEKPQPERQSRGRELLEQRVEELNQRAESLAEISPSEQLARELSAPDSSTSSASPTTTPASTRSRPTGGSPTAYDPHKRWWGLLFLLTVGIGVVLWYATSYQNAAQTTQAGSATLKPVYASPTMQVSLHPRRDSEERMMHPLAPRSIVRVHGCKDQWCQIEHNTTVGWLQTGQLRPLPQANFQHATRLLSSRDSGADVWGQPTPDLLAHVHDCYKNHCRVLVKIPDKGDRIGLVPRSTLTESRPTRLPQIR